ncbi:MAG TPA: outer membrane protein assembly factor BamE [Verrucomicrobiae bacterium]|jgi:outer membrane protein assembly factor BamE (lipoprotein component of BamABCDE complex)
MKSTSFILIAIGAMLLAGCVSYGRKIDQSKAAQIKIGQTTRSQVVQLIGSPDQITTMGDGLVTFHYMFVRATPNAANFVPIVGAFAGGANVQNESLMIMFTNDVVSQFINSYGGNEMGMGASAASTTSLTNTVDNKRPK